MDLVGCATLTSREASFCKLFGLGWVVCFDDFSDGWVAVIETNDAFVGFVSHDVWCWLDLFIITHNVSRKLESRQFGNCHKLYLRLRWARACLRALRTPLPEPLPRNFLPELCIQFGVFIVLVVFYGVLIYYNILASKSEHFQLMSSGSRKPKKIG